MQSFEFRESLRRFIQLLLRHELFRNPKVKNLNDGYLGNSMTRRTSNSVKVSQMGEASRIEKWKKQKSYRKSQHGQYDH